MVKRCKDLMLADRELVDALLDQAEDVDRPYFYKRIRDKLLEASQ
jgi:hypothetical protein